MPGTFDIAAIAAAVVGSKDMLQMVYKDLAQPGVKQVGTAVETILGLGNTMLLPIKFLNDRANTAFVNNMERYRCALQGVPVEEIRAVSPEIGVPVLDRFTYVTDEVIAEMFVKLLADASQTERVSEAHPAFIHVIDNMSPDEAKLLQAMTPNAIHCFGSCDLFHKPSGAVIARSNFLLAPNILERAQLVYPGHIASYIDNLVRLGIFSSPIVGPTAITNSLGEEIKTAYAHVFQRERPYYEDNDVRWSYGLLHYTDFGQFFRRSCVTKQQPSQPAS